MDDFTAGIITTILAMIVLYFLGFLNKRFQEWLDIDASFSILKIIILISGEWILGISAIGLIIYIGRFLLLWR